MTTILFGFDSLAPVIGGAVLTSTFGFFSGVILGRRNIERTRKSLTENAAIDHDAACQPLELRQLSVSASNQTVELWLREAANCPSFASFLKRIATDPSRGFAAIVGTGVNGSFPRIAEGLSKRSVAELFVSENLIRRLRSESPLVLDSDLDLAGILRCLDEIDRNKVQTLTLTAVNDGDEMVAVLMTSMRWPLGDTTFEQRHLMNQAARTIGSRWHQMLALEQQAQELRLTREMLDLRNIIDSQSDEPIESLNQFARRLRDIVDTDRVAIYFTSRRAGEQMQPIVQCGRRLPPEIDPAWQQHEQVLAKTAIESEVGKIRNGDWLKQLPADSPITSSVSLPIRVNRRILGALTLTTQDHHGALDSRRKIIEFAAEILSKTLRRVFDEATIRRQANRDHLTDLVNRRSLDGYLAAEVERINNGDSQTCSLILADLDHFKTINDRFGHQQGDHVLREAARILSEQVSRMRTGEHSIVARYGGEEFAILLPNVGQLGAMRIAEGIRAAIESQSIRVHETALNITLSLGVAVCPHQANTVESLIAAADRALYQAKSQGRNCVFRADAETEALRSF